MNRLLIIGSMLLFVAVSLTNVAAEEKLIDTNEFVFGEGSGFVNLTEKELVIDGSLYNDTANLFIHNNATYDLLSFDVTAAPSDDGVYPSEVTVDVGDNGRPEYRFSGYGVGAWGNQTSFMSASKTSYKTAEIYPSPQGDIYYVKLPTKAVVKSASVNLEHPPGSVSKSVRIPSTSWNWAIGWVYGSGSYNYLYYYPGSSYAGYYVHQTSTTYSLPAYKSGNYYYRGMYHRGYLSWNLNDPNMLVPPGANLQEYKLTWLSQHFGNYFRYNGVYNYYIGERDYGLYALTTPITTSYNYLSIYYSSYSSIPSYINSYWPNMYSTPYDSYHIPMLTGYSSYYVPIEWDLTDLLGDWQDGSRPNYGISFRMDATPIEPSGEPHDSYSTSSSANNYYYGWRRGYFYSPGASSSYNAYKPYISLAYSLDSISPWMDVGDDGIKDWSNPGYFNTSAKPSGLQGSMNQYLTTHFPDEVDDYGNEWSYVPIRIGADSGGKLIVSDMKVLYDYTASIYFNPFTDTATKELQSLVPSTEEGSKMVNINVMSNTRGKIVLDNLQMEGKKPNYRPETMEIPDVSVSEGSVDRMLIPISDYFMDIDQDSTTLDYRIRMNDQSEHVDLFLTTTNSRDGKVYLGIDTRKDENWFGTVTTRISVLDDFGKDAWSNQFKISVEPVNDLPFGSMEFQDITTSEGINSILLEYSAPSGRDVATGKEMLMVHRSGAPYFYDIEDQPLYFDFELMGPDMAPAELAWSNEDGYKIFRGPDNEAYLTVLPPEYTEDPENWILLFGSDPDFTTAEGPYHVMVYVSDDRNDLRGQYSTSFSFYVNSVNDAPIIKPIPDIIMNEDDRYISPTAFISEYVSDIDNKVEELNVKFYSSDPSVGISVDGSGRLHVDLDLDFNGVVPVTMEVFDGENKVTSSFNVRVRSVNDPPLVVVKNLYEGQLITELYRIKGTADDIEKSLYYIQVAITKKGDILYLDDWTVAEGAYVWQYLVDIREFDDGDYMVYIRGFDGRDYSDVQIFEITVETAKPAEPSDPPVVQISTSLTGEQTGTITVDGTVTDESGYVNFVEYRIDGGIWRKASQPTGTNWEVVIDTNTLTNEEHNLSVRAYDGKSYSDLVFKKFVVMNEDSDKDGIPNDIESALLMDPFNKLDGTMDFDGDGFSNYQELMGDEKTDPFDANSHPERSGDKESLIDTWTLIFMIVAIVCAVVIIGLFVLNVRLERNIQHWKEDLNRRRTQRKPKTLLQKIVEIAPSFIGGGFADQGPALPGTSPGMEHMDALPPMRDR
ncbi:MAG: Ig-like domain-containing protein [Thermoplasmatota archaeon]